MSIGEGQNVEQPLNLFSPQQAITVPHPLLPLSLSRPRVALISTTWGQQLMCSGGHTISQPPHTLPQTAPLQAGGHCSIQPPEPHQQKAEMRS